MPRTQEFDTDIVVGRARDLFWDRGFEAASVPDLELATGLNRSSLYNAFGSKRGLFDAAVQDYLERVVRPRLRILTDEPTAPEAAMLYYRGVVDMIESSPADHPGRGCLLLNSAAGFASRDDAQRAVIDAYRSELAAALAHALRALDPGTPVDQVVHRTRLLTSLSISALLLSRVNREEAAALARTALDQLAQWSAARTVEGR